MQLYKLIFEFSKNKKGFDCYESTFATHPPANFLRMHLHGFGCLLPAMAQYTQEKEPRSKSEGYSSNLHRTVGVFVQHICNIHILYTENTSQNNSHRK